MRYSDSKFMHLAATPRYVARSGFGTGKGDGYGYGCGDGYGDSTGSGYGYGANGYVDESIGYEDDECVDDGIGFGIGWGSGTGKGDGSGGEAETFDSFKKRLCASMVKGGQ